jgi:RNA polymerase sigma-70 factor (ECF subfamily)
MSLATHTEVMSERYEELRARLVPFVARRVPHADVDDVVQEVFVRLSRHRAQLVHEERYDAWMWAIARNAVEDRHRDRARHPLAHVEGETEPGAHPPIDATHHEQHVEAIQEALASLVAPLIAMLPSPYREALTLVELEGLTQLAAAEMLEVPLSTMKARVQRGRVKLRALFDGFCEISVDARGRVVSCEPRAMPCAQPTSCECGADPNVRNA